MCLSSVYLDDKATDTLVLREASLISVTSAGVDVATLFGESKSVAGYYVAEVNVMENYVILKPRGDTQNVTRT